MFDWQYIRVNLRQRSGQTVLDEGWFWNLHDGSVLECTYALSFLFCQFRCSAVEKNSPMWEVDEPNDLGQASTIGIEDSDEDSGVVGLSGYLLDVSETYAEDTAALCQFPRGSALNTFISRQLDVPPYLQSKQSLRPRLPWERPLQRQHCKVPLTPFSRTFSLQMGRLESLRRLCE